MNIDTPKRQVSNHRCFIYAVLALLITLGVSSQASAALTDGLVAYYSFEGTANDVSGNGNHGVENGGLVYANGVTGQAVKFDGIDDWIQVNNSSSFPTEEISISYWVKQDNLPGNWTSHISKDFAFESYLRSDGLFESGVWTGTPGVWRTSYSGSYKYNVGNWVMYTWTFSNTTKTYKTFVNGTLVNEGTESDGNAYLRTSSVPMTIGTARSGGQNYYYLNGLIDELRIYNRTLTADEVTALYNTSQNNGLVAYYPFNGNANDESGNTNNGIENGGVTYTTGIIGQAAKFDGVNDFIEITPKSNVSSIEDFSISVWTNLADLKNQPSNKKDRQYIFDAHTGSSTTTTDFFSQGFGLIYDGDNNSQEIHDFIFYDLNTSLEQNTNFEVKGKWLHHIFIRKGNMDSTYINGKLIQSTYTDYNHRSGNPLNIQHNWFIGTAMGNNPNYNNGTFNYSFYGLLDDLRIYNRALTDAEVTALYNGGSVVAAKTVQITGQIKLDLQPTETVKLSVSGDGLAEFCPVDTDGKFNCKVPLGWTGYLIPKLEGVKFSPNVLHTADAQTNLEAGDVIGERIFEVLKVEPTEAVKNSYTIFTVTGSNLTDDSIRFDLAGCLPTNDEYEPENATTMQRRFRCMPTATGGKIGRILSTADDKLLKVFHVKVLPKAPKVTSVTPKTALFGEDTLFTVTGSNLVSDMVFSLNECDKIQEVGAGSTTKRLFQCTPKNSEGKQPGKVSLKDGSLLKDFSVSVSSIVKAKTVKAELSYFTKPRFAACASSTLCGYFPLGDLTDVATFSSTTPWYVKVNGKKTYSGALGDSAAGIFHFYSGETHIDLASNEGTVNFSWDKKAKKIKFSLQGALPTLISELGKKPTIEFGLATTTAVFAVDLSKNPKSVTVKTANWRYDPRNVDSVSFLTQETIALRKSLLDQYVYPRLEMQSRLLMDLNDSTMTFNEQANTVVEWINWLGKGAFSLKAGKNMYDAGKVFKFSPTQAEVGRVVLEEAFRQFTPELAKIFAKKIASSACPLANCPLYVEQLTDVALTIATEMKITQVSPSLAFDMALKVYKISLDGFSAYTINNRLELIYANRIAKEVIKQYVDNDGSIYGLAEQVLIIDPKLKTWENVIKGVASNMDCRAGIRCSVGIFEDYDPEVVNNLVQDYLSTIRAWSGYGEFYLHNP